MGIVYKPEKKKGAGRPKKSEATAPLKFKGGLSSPLKVKYGSGPNQFYYIFADVDLDKNRTTIISVHTHEILGVVKSVERFQVEKAARWLVTLRVQMATLPTLFDQVNQDVFKLQMSKDHFNLTAQGQQPTTGSLVSLVHKVSASTSASPSHADINLNDED